MTPSPRHTMMQRYLSTYGPILGRCGGLIVLQRKLFDFSRTLTAKLQSHRQAQQAQAAAQQGQSSQLNQQNRPSSQGQLAESQGQQFGGEAGGQNANAAAAAQQAAQQARPQPKISPKLLEHASNFPYVLPPHLTAGTPEGAKWIQEAKSKYLKALVAMEGASNRVQTIDTLTKQKIAEGKTLSPEEERDFKEKKEAAQKTYNDAKNFVDGFRNSQNQQRAAANGGIQAQQGAGSNGGNPNLVGAAAPVRPQMSVQQQAQNPAIMQNTQTVNAAIEAAKNQQMGANRPPMPQNGQLSQPGSSQGQSAPSTLPPQQGQMNQPQIKTEAGVPPPINTSITQLQRKDCASQGK